MKLSPQELKAVSLTAEGLTAKEVAHVMRISTSAVNLYLGKARTKMGVTNTYAVVAIAVRNQMI